MSEQPKTFQVGDTVTWTSQAGGNAKTKTGMEFRPLRRDSLRPSGAALVSTMPAPSGGPEVG